MLEKQGIMKAKQLKKTDYGLRAGSMSFPACRIAFLGLVFTALSPCLWPQAIIGESTTPARVSIYPGPVAMTQVDSEPFQFGENINWMSLLRVPCSSPELDRAANCLDDGALASLPFAQDTAGTGTPKGSALTAAELQSPAEYFARRNVTPSRTTVVTHVMPVAWNVSDPAIEDDAKSDSTNATNPNAAPVEPINRASNQKQGKTRIQWKPLLLETLLSTSIMHTFNLWTEAGTRDALYGPWFKDYLRSLSELRGWSDSDRFMAPYVGHSIQGSIYGFTLRQNDPKYRDVQWGDGRDYWISILRSMAFSAAAHAQWKIGPLSEASIGNVMLHASPGFITLVTTPTLGALTMIGEDSLDRYLIIGLENRSSNGMLIILARSFLNPGRSFANVMAFKKPWYRPTRIGLENDYDLLIRKEMVADFKDGVGPKLFEFVKRPQVSTHSESNVAAIELAAYANYENFSGRNCIGGGGSGAARINAAWQIVTEVNGCLIMGFPMSTESGDSLFYGGGPRWTPRASHKVSPYLEFLVGGRKVTYDVNDPALHALLREEWNDGNGTLTHYPKRSDWSSETASNGASIAAGGGVDLVVTRAFAWRFSSQYTHSWMSDVQTIHPQNGFRVTTEAVLRIGKW